VYAPRHRSGGDTMARRVGLALLALVLVGGILIPAQVAAQPEPTANAKANAEGLKGGSPE